MIIALYSHNWWTLSDKFRSPGEGLVTPGHAWLQVSFLRDWDITGSTLHTTPHQTRDISINLHLTVRAEWRGWLGTNHSEHSGPSSRCKVAAPGHRPGQWIMSTVLLNNDEFLVCASIYSTRHVKLSQMLTSAGSCLTCPRGLLRYSKLSQEMHWDQKLFSQNWVWLALARPAGGCPCSSLGVIMVRRRWQPRKPVIISLPG